MRRSLLFSILGLLSGIAVGLYLGWFAFPVVIVDVIPADLEPEVQDDYLRLIAATYATDQNLVFAQSRIAALDNPNWQDWLRGEAIDAILLDPDSLETEQLIRLALVLGVDSPAFEPYRAEIGGSE